MVYEFTATDDTAYFFGLHLVSSDDYRYVLNAHGDVIALVSKTGSTVAKYYEYDAFGNEINPDSSDTNPYRYCAEYFDTESGTIYLRARYYSPMHGRFTQVDSARDGLNWYAYCYNNPVAFVDPWGTDAIVANQSENVAGFGHMGAFVQDDDGSWYFFYFGNSLVTLIKVEDAAVLESKESINEWIRSQEEFKDTEYDYDSFCYIEGDFSQTKDYFCAVESDYKDDLKVNKRNIFNDKNSNYNALFNNCAQVTMSGIKLGIGKNGKTVGYTLELCEIGISPIPNVNINNLKMIYRNASYKKQV